MTNNNFPEGIRTFTPNAKAPSFVKADFLINRDEMISWLQTQPQEVKLSLKESKSGSKLYLSINNFGN